MNSTQLEKPWTICAVDNYPAILLALRNILRDSNFELIAETGSGSEAISLIKKYQPDCVILDISLNDLDGIAVIKRIKELGLKTKFLVMTSYGKSAEVARRCLQAGAEGVIDKTQDLDDILIALNALVKGMSCYSSNVNAAFMSGEFSPLSRLSYQEFSVFKEIIKGKRNKDIADDLKLSPKTISTYKNRILRKLKVNSDQDLIRLSSMVGFNPSDKLELEQ